VSHPRWADCRTAPLLLTDENRANEQMRGLQGLGVKVALDDFGTRYSSLQYLRRFGFDKLKIDRSFIDGAGAPQDSSIILASIIKLGHDLDLTIAAEGVETEEQQRWLQASGCHHQLQGYLFSRPIRADDAVHRRAFGAGRGGWLNAIEWRPRLRKNCTGRAHCHQTKPA
jgi:EAL domain-containing protein (putative c-di-GMP-specific phosphodiesterase class I)